MGNKKDKTYRMARWMNLVVLVGVVIAVPGCIAAFPEASRVIKNALDGPPWTRPDVKVCQSYLSESHDIFSRRSPRAARFLLSNERCEHYAERPLPRAGQGNLWMAKLSADQPGGHRYLWCIRREARQ